MYKTNLFYILSRINGYNINKSIIYLDSLKKLSQDSYYKKQKSIRNNILKYHYNSWEWYRKRIGNLKEKKWDEFPILTKTDLQDYHSELANNKQIKRNNYFANTSGSSGHPFSFIKNKACHSLAWAKIVLSYSDLNISLNDKEARFFGNVKNSQNIKFYEKIKDFLLYRYRLDVFDLSDDCMNK